MNKKTLSMRWRFTLIVGVFMLIIIGIITAVLMYNAKHQFTVFANVFLPIEDASANPENIILVPENSIDSSSTSDTIIFDDFNSLKVADNMGDVSEIKFAMNDVEKNYIGFTLLFVSLFAIICVIITYFLVGHMLRPLENFEKTINMISENNFSGELWSKDEIRKDEIGKLQQAFVAMSQRLEAAFIKQKQFSVNAAHELKTPISVIKTGIQVIDIDQEDDIQEYRDTFRIISNNVDRLSKIVDDLLCFSNNEDILFEQVNLELLIKTIVQEVQFMAEKLHISFLIEIKSICLFAHPTLLYQALFNLIENAVKYNQINGKISISAEQIDDVVEVCIANTGTSIPEEKFDQIFESFYRLDPSRSKKINGYGLGLAISKDIIAKHHSAIAVSVKEQCNLFSITLPYNKPLV